MTPIAPTWTRARLERVMCLRFGFAHDGTSPDTANAAAALGVSRRTVQRWLHAAHGRSLAHIPPRRLEQLVELLLPTAETRAREAQQARYAERAISGLHLPRKMGIKPAWERQRWLEPHVVVVLEIRVRHLRIRQLAIARAEETRVSELHRRGRIIDQAVVPTRFHATVVAHRALSELAPWRFQALPEQVQQGFTQSWLDDAPPSRLARWAVDLKAALEPPASAPRRRRTSGAVGAAH